MGELLDEITHTGHISTWTPVVYEPETRAFGGTEAMAAAHALFCADTRHLMEFLAAAEGGPDRRKEVSLLLCHTLMRAAGLDRYEQGDVWDRVASTRPLHTAGPPPEKVHHKVHRLLSVDPGPRAAHFAPSGAFAGFALWAQAFQDCGHELADLHTRGRLERGLRAVLAHHVIFCWNRLGLSAPVQAVLSHTAARIIFDPETVNL
ncbi:thiopeptide-type bacteriocin biosynthesis domain protein [Nocardiopsis alba ATCC BAA-2165]|uniref:Thiopeptide-type bacteriocin biosynthesis domain protein n=1 Tax=Nocardiopsis alba (strain ATCC BAA-2165 / BE74) TaxID=1205910 RepID=J7L8R7_NOCAA|nr:thiopeptide-type bacteriocin biosynthesis domain protein [Nocardiopsis alba ATCC BAA-2165]